MSRRPAIIRQKDVERICKGAAAAGIHMGIVVTGNEVRFIPVDAPLVTGKPSALEAWKAKRNVGKDRGDS